MTRKEAKRILYVFRSVILVDASHIEAFDMAMKALEQEPFEDCVRRSDVMVLIEDTNLKHLSFTRGISQKAFEDLLNGAQDLLPVTPKPKTGRWIKGKCDQCGGYAPFWPMASTYYRSKYCPNCGARMVESEDKK